MVKPIYSLIKTPESLHTCSTSPVYQFQIYMGTNTLIFNIQLPVTLEKNAYLSL